MPGGNITAGERFRRISEIKDLQEEGKSDYAISEETGIPIATVKRNIKYIKDLANAELSPEEISGKRAEIYLELKEAIVKAKQLFNNASEAEDPVMASIAIQRFFNMWMEALKSTAGLYGLDTVKVDNYFQFNQLNQMNRPTFKLKVKTADRLRNAIIKEHEDTLKEKDEET